MFRLLTETLAHVLDDHSNGAKASPVGPRIYVALLVVLSGLAAWYWWSDGAIRAWAFAKNALVFAIWAPLIWIAIRMKLRRRYDLFPLFLALLALMVIFHQFVLPLEIGR